jgi:hypothetical protein
MPVETSVKQMALTKNQEFMDRLTAVMAFTAGSILKEAISAPYHVGRAQYANRVVNQPVMSSQTAGPQVVMGVNVINTTVYDEATKTATCTIADIDLESQVQSLWNSLAGLDTPA